MHNSHVYFVTDGSGSGLIKIGYSSFVRRRLNCGGLGWRLLGCMSGTRHTERTVHERFRHLRKHGEWFQDSSEIRDFIEAHGLGEKEVFILMDRTITRTSRDLAAEHSEARWSRGDRLSWPIIYGRAKDFCA